MKRLAVMVVWMGLAVAFGCGRSEPSAPSAGGQPVSTNQGDSAGEALEKYGRVMATAKKSTQIKMDLISVNQAIQAFAADRGRYPHSLEEIVQEGFLPRLPELPAGKKYHYNAQTGDLTVMDGP